MPTVKALDDIDDGTFPRPNGPPGGGYCWVGDPAYDLEVCPRPRPPPAASVELN